MTLGGRDGGEEPEQVTPGLISHETASELVMRLRRALPKAIEIRVIHHADGRLQMPTIIPVEVGLTLPEVMALGVDVRIVGMDEVGAAPGLVRSIR